MDAVARGILRPQVLALTPAVVGNDGVGRVQDRLRGAVVLLQPDDLRALVLLLEREDIFDRRTAEFVDGLVVVADNADVLISAREQRRELSASLPPA